MSVDRCARRCDINEPGTAEACATRECDCVGRTVLLYVVSVAAAVLLFACVALLASPVRAQDALPPMKPKDAASGTLLLKAAGETVAAPLLSTDVVIRVSGLAARAHVTQTFRNTTDDWLEGIYVFPLPENAAVDHLRMRVGERMVEAEIREREAARREYVAARQSGQRAALLEQERPNIFTSSVANIGPGESVVVEIEYQQTLRYDANRYSLRFPMVVGPRYIPGEPSAKQGRGWAPDTTMVSDASRITPPVYRPGSAPVNPVSLRVELDAGVPLAAIDSPYHKVFVSVSDHRRQTITLQQGRVPANRDFELTWTPTAETAPRVSWFAERMAVGGVDRHYGLLMINPPTQTTGTKRIPREAVFVIDTSGSMSGTSIVQAKEALEMAIDRLAPGDRFNVIEFNSYARAMFGSVRPANAANRAEARGWIRALRAQGGTEIAKALDMALDGKEHPERIRQVVFLTDGAVGNEDALFRLIRERLGDSRLFTIGIGSAPNSHFMARAAETGRGTFTYIGKVEEVREKMTTLFARLESPVLKGVRVEWPAGVTVESWPKQGQMRDLYAGEPLVLTASLDRLHGSVRVSGQRGDKPWETTVALDEPAQGAGMGVLWARDKISALEDDIREGKGGSDTRAQLIEVASAHHLVTKYTSLVAIDRTPTRALDTVLKTAAVPTNMPEGWELGSVMGELPQGSTSSRFHLLLGAVLMVLAMLMLLTQRHARPRMAS
jgi:Ca-activated chloride channel homolog